nr:MAG TPA: Biotin synthase [Caudoviricetes sp.]
MEKNKMIIKGLTDEDFVNYKKPAMFIATSKCSFKCEKECGVMGMCQNHPLATAPQIAFSDEKIVERFLSNDISEAIVFGGLEPFDQFNELFLLIKRFREKTNDDIVIYTGYNENEIEAQVKELGRFKNIIIKFGRYIPNQVSHYDELLGAELASDNQYAKRIN